MSSTNRYPQFDTLEIILEREFSIQRFKKLSPLKAGNQIPGFSFTKGAGHWAQYVKGAESNIPVFQNQLLNKPLVIAFYAEQWGDKAKAHLIKLNSIQHEVKALGGNLIVISPEQPKSLAKLVWEHELTLNFYFDTNNQIATGFGVFDAQNPTWNLFSGIDENLPLLSVYVINPSQQIVYHFINHDLESTFRSEDVLLAVYDSGAYKSRLISA